MVFSHFQTQVWSEIIKREPGRKIYPSDEIVAMLLRLSVSFGYLTAASLKFISKENEDKHRELISQTLGEILIWTAAIASSIGVRLGQVAEESLKNFREEKDS